MKRHTCIICGTKRNEVYMKKVFRSSWVCTCSFTYFSSRSCQDHEDIKLGVQIFDLAKKLEKINLKHISR